MVVFWNDERSDQSTFCENHVVACGALMDKAFFLKNTNQFFPGQWSDSWHFNTLKSFFQTKFLVQPNLFYE
jgi:hypothetical protein